MDDAFAMADEIKSTMSSEDLKRYDKLGNDLYCAIDYNKNASVDPNHFEIMHYIKIAVKSGLNPNFLTDEEKTFLESYYDDKDWKNKLLAEIQQK